MFETIVRELAVAVYLVAFTVLAWRSWAHWRHRGDRASLWFSIAFASLALVVGAGLVANAVWGDDPPHAVTVVLVALLCVYSPAIMRFAAAFGQVRRVEYVAAAVVFALLALATIGLHFPPPGHSGSATFTAFTLLFVVAWLVTTMRVVSSLWISAAQRPGIVRGRMRLLAAGFALLDLALVLQAFDVGGPSAPVVPIVTAISSVVMLAGLAPPQWLRIVLRQPEQQHLRAMVASLVSASRAEQVLERLLPATRDVLGATAIAVLAGPGREPLALGYTPEQLDDIRAALDATGLANGEATVVDRRLVVREGDLWAVVDQPRDGAFFGADELDVLVSIVSIAAITLGRIEEGEAVREHERRLQTAVDIAGIGKWEWWIGTERIHWSPRMREIYGLGDHDGPITYTRYRSMLDPSDRDRVGALIQHSIETGEPFDFDHTIRRQPDGAAIVLHSSGRVVFGSDGMPERLTGITADITARKREEAALRAEVELERATADRLREIDELRNNILSAVSHELRTPLTAVHGFAILLQDRVDEMSPEQRREIVDHLAAESERLRRLFADLLDIDRLRRGRVEADRVPTDVRGMVLEVVGRSRIVDRVVLDVPELEFPLDAPKFERILENLVSNAEKYAGAASTVHVRVRVTGDDELELRVEDDGPGVDPEQRERVFEPFNRGDAELGHAPGTGIGLALVAQFARVHGGRASVEASASGGAAFVVTLGAGGVPVVVR